MNPENYNVDIQILCEFILQRIALTDARITILDAKFSAFLQHQHPEKAELLKAAAPTLQKVGSEQLRLMLEELSLESQEMKTMIESLLAKSQ